MAKNYIIKEKLENGQFETLHPETNAGNVLVTDTHGALGTANASADLQDLADFLAAKALDDTTLKSIVIDDLSVLDNYKTPDIYRFHYPSGPELFHLFVVDMKSDYIIQYRTRAKGYARRETFGKSWSEWVEYSYAVNGITTAVGNRTYKKGAIITDSNGKCYIALVDGADVASMGVSASVWYELTNLPDKINAKMDTATAEATYVKISDIGATVAPLDENNLIPGEYLPSYVDDVLEYATQANFPTTGESGKIYVALNTNITYRWSGSGYVEISASLALGETSSTAYAGNKGKANAEAIMQLERDVEAIEGIVGGSGPGSLQELISKVADIETVNNTQNTEIANIKNGTTKVSKSTTADKLATAQTINVKGDITGSVSFDGSAAKDLTLTLPNTGVTAGTYSAVSVNAKGQVTAGAYMIEVGAEGATAPTSNLAVGGIFFQHKA